MQRGSFLAAVLALIVSNSALSADALKNRIAFTRAAPAFMRVFSSNANGADERPLMPAIGMDYNPSFSPDGEWIVFTSERAGSADLYRVRADGSALERLTDSPSYDDQGALSPDGKTLAFVSTRADGRAHVWLLDIARRKFSRVTKGSSGNFRPSWSPDGEWLTFTSDRHEPHRRREPSWEIEHFTAVYVVRRGGSGLRRLTALAEFDHSPKWTSDGRHVNYSSRADVRGRSEFVSVDVSTGVVTPQLSVNPADGAASLSPDGKTKVFAKAVKGPEQKGSGVASVFSLNNRFELLRTGTFPVSSPDGHYLLVAGGFSNSPFGTSNNVLSLVDPAGTPRRTLFEGPTEMGTTSPAWSPDGKSIAFSMGVFFDRPVKPGQLAMIDADGSNLRMLTQGNFSSGFPSFSPDGKRLVFRVLGDGQQGLRLLSMQSGEVTSITKEWDNFPAWSPGGDRIAFSSFRTGDFEIFTVRTDGKDVRQLTHDHANNAHARWSPDGKWIVFTSSRMGWKDEGYGSDQGYGEIFVMRADGTGMIQLTDNQWEDATASWLIPTHH